MHTIAHCSILFPTVGWLTTSALAANLAYLYMLPLCTFFSSLYHNVVIQSTSLQHCDISCSPGCSKEYRGYSNRKVIYLRAFTIKNIKMKVYVIYRSIFKRIYHQK